MILDDAVIIDLYKTDGSAMLTVYSNKLRFNNATAEEMGYPDYAQLLFAGKENILALRFSERLSLSSSGTRQAQEADRHQLPRPCGHHQEIPEDGERLGESGDTGNLLPPGQADVLSHQPGHLP